MVLPWWNFSAPAGWSDWNFNYKNDPSCPSGSKRSVSKKPSFGEDANSNPYGFLRRAQSVPPSRSRSPECSANCPPNSQCESRSQHNETVLPLQYDPTQSLPFDPSPPCKYNTAHSRSFDKRPHQHDPLQSHSYDSPPHRKYEPPQTHSFHSNPSRQGEPLQSSSFDSNPSRQYEPPISRSFDSNPSRQYEPPMSHSFDSHPPLQYETPQSRSFDSRPPRSCIDNRPPTPPRRCCRHGPSTQNTSNYTSHGSASPHYKDIDSDEDQTPCQPLRPIIKQGLIRTDDRIQHNHAIYPTSSKTTSGRRRVRFGDGPSELRESTSSTQCIPKTPSFKLPDNYMCSKPRYDMEESRPASSPAASSSFYGCPRNPCSACAPAHPDAMERNPPYTTSKCASDTSSEEIATSTSIRYEDEINPPSYRSGASPPSYRPQREGSRTHLCSCALRDTYDCPFFEDFVCKASKKHIERSGFFNSCEHCPFITSEQRDSPNRRIEESCNFCISENTRFLKPNETEETEYYCPFLDCDVPSLGRSLITSPKDDDSDDDDDESFCPYIEGISKPLGCDTPSDLDYWERLPEVIDSITNYEDSSLSDSYDPLPALSDHLQSPRGKFTTKICARTNGNSMKYFDLTSPCASDPLAALPKPLMPDYSRFSLPLHPQSSTENSSRISSEVQSSMSCVNVCTPGQHIGTYFMIPQKKSTCPAFDMGDVPRTPWKAKPKWLLKRAESFHSMPRNSQTSCEGFSQRYSDPIVQEEPWMQETVASSDIRTHLQNHISNFAKEEFIKRRAEKVRRIFGIPRPTPLTCCCNFSKPVYPSKTSRKKKEPDQKKNILRSPPESVTPVWRYDDVCEPYITSLEEEYDGGPWHATVVAQGVEYDVSATVVR